MGNEFFKNPRISLLALQICLASPRSKGCNKAPIMLSAEQYIAP
jgi:hypothetical protein